MAEEGIDIELLRDRGLTCSKLKQLENKEKRDKQNAYKDAQKYRSYGFSATAELQERVGKAQEETAQKISQLRKRICGLK